MKINFSSYFKISSNLLIVLLITFFNIQFNSNAQNAIQLDAKAKEFSILQNFDSAIFYSEKALAYRESKNEITDTNYISNLSNLGEYYYYIANYQSAISFFSKGILFVEKIQGKKNQNYATLINNIAYSYSAVEDYKKALLFFNEEKDLIFELYGEKHPVYAESIGNIGMIYLNTGNFEKAEPLLTKNVEIRKKYTNEKSIEYANAINDLAIFYKGIGDYSKAEPFFIQAKDIYKELLGPKSPGYSSEINNLAVLYQEMARSTNDKKSALDNLKKSEIYLVESTEIDKEFLGEKNKDYAVSLNNLASLYLTLAFYTNSKTEANSYYTKAEDIYFKSMAIRKEIYGEKHSVYANSLFNLANLYQLKNDYLKSETYYLEALEIRKTTLGENHPDYIQNVNSIARFYELINNYSKATSFYLENVNKRQEQIQKNFNFLSESEKENFVNSITKDFDSFYDFAASQYNKNPSLAGNFYNSFASTKGLVLNSSLNLFNKIKKSNDSTLVNLYSRWVKEKGQLGMFEQFSKNKQKALGLNLDSLENLTVTMEKELIRKSSIFSENQKLASVTWQEVQKNLKKDEAAIEFIKFNKTQINVPDTVIYGALVIRPGYLNPKLVCLFDEKQIEDILNRMASNRGVQILEQPATKEKSIELYDLIWKPIDSLLKGCKTVFFSPIGLLYRVSFASLTPPDQKYLFDKYNLKVLSCTRNIRNDNKILKVDPGFNSVIFGGIQYELDANKQIAVTKKYTSNNTETQLAYNDNPEMKNFTRGGAWNYLRGTLTESNVIIDEFKKSKINAELISGENAVEESFKSISGKSPTIIHIATHGFYIANNKNIENGNSENPLFRSGLIMAGANRVWTGEKSLEGIDDGILTAYEVSLLDLSNTKLVVLSACETGLGDIKGSEGVYGLQRAFKMAGVDYLIITLWEIQDAVTVEFMSIFYQQWLKGKDIHAAFKNAQDEMRKKYEANYWAAFVLME